MHTYQVSTPSNNIATGSKSDQNVMFLCFFSFSILVVGNSKFTFNS